MPSHCVIAGETVVLTGVTPEALGPLADALGDGVPGAGEPALHLHAAPGTIAAPPRPPDRVVEHIELWADGGAVVVRTRGRELARVSHATAVLDADEADGIRSLVLPVLSLLLADRGACVAHASAFLAVGGGAVLGLGGSGRGKSTLVTAALGAGLRVLGDDLVVLRLGDGDDPGGTDGARPLLVSGVPRPVALPADVADDRVVGPAIEGDPRGRRASVAPLRIDGRWHPLAAVVVVDHSADPDGGYGRAVPRDVLRAALASTVDGLGVGTVRAVFPYAAAIARADGWCLGHAADPARRVAGATRWMAAAGLLG